MPIGMNSGELPGDGAASSRAIATDDVALAVEADAAPAALFQVKTRLAFRPCRRATSATEAPGRTASSTIRRFSSGDHKRREPLPRSLLVVGLVFSKDALNLRVPSAAG
jgi:hypothetical protein